MGYDIRVVGTQFFIARKNKLQGLEALQEAVRGHEEDLRWQVPKHEIYRSGTLREALEHFGWHITMDDDGDYIEIDYEQEKLGDDFFWHDLAPFIKKGSYIEISGHGGEDRFRYYFDGKCFREQDAVMSWKDKD